MFVEKPLAIDEAGLEKVIAALGVGAATTQKGKASPSTPPGLLTVGFNRRFAPLAVSLSRFLEKRSEPLHAHYRVNAGYLPLNHWTQDPFQGGGRVIGEACHFVDFLAFLAGAAPVSVSAQALPDLGRYRSDNLAMTFTFPDGSIGVLDYLANGDKSFPKERLEVFCAGDVAVLDDFRSLETVRSGKRTVEKGAQDKGWSGEWSAFAAAIQSGGQPPIPYEHLVGVTTRCHLRGDGEFTREEKTDLSDLNMDLKSKDPCTTTSLPFASPSCGPCRIGSASKKTSWITNARSRGLPTFLARSGGSTAGFLSLKQHNPFSTEIYVMGVRPEARRLGLGRLLVEAAEGHAHELGAEYMQVKTLGPSRPDKGYAATLAFYAALGYRPLEEFPQIWGENNPCLILVKRLAF